MDLDDGSASVSLVRPDGIRGLAAGSGRWGQLNWEATPELLPGLAGNFVVEMEMEMEMEMETQPNCFLHAG